MMMVIGGGVVQALVLRGTADNGDDDLPSTTFRLCPKHISYLLREISLTSPVLGRATH